LPSERSPKRQGPSSPRRQVACRRARLRGGGTCVLGCLGWRQARVSAANGSR
jgi:hypothetical protein